MTSLVGSGSSASKSSGACLLCKQRKRRCAGGYPCDLCAARQVECVYSDSLDRRKKASQRKERAVAASQKAALLELVRLIRFRRDDDVRTFIRSGATAEAIMEWLGSDNDDSTADPGWDLSTNKLDVRSSLVEDVSQAIQLTQRASGGLSKERSSLGQNDTNLVVATSRMLVSATSHASGHTDIRNRYRVHCTVLHNGSDDSNIALFGSLPFANAWEHQAPQWHLSSDQMSHLQLPKYLIQPLLLDEERCPMGAVYTDFRDFGRDRISQGIPMAEVLGGEQVTADLYFRDRRGGDGHTPSTWACEYMKLIQDLDIFVGLASIYLYASFMRWVISPTQINYNLLPVAMRPTALQRFVPHHPGVDLPVFPEMRDGLIFDMRDYIVAQQTLGCTVNWPHGLDEALDVDIETSCITISQSFADHVSNVNNWTVSGLFADVFPELKGRYDISTQPVIPMSRDGIGEFLAQHPGIMK